MGVDGRGYVRDNLAAEKIVGTEDSTIPGQLVDTGAKAQAFAKVMRHHTLESTGGKTYSEMGRFMDGRRQGHQRRRPRRPRTTPASRSRTGCGTSG